VEVYDLYWHTQRWYTFTTQGTTIPGAPTNLQGTTGSSWINLTWNKGVNADYTFVEWDVAQTWNYGDGLLVENTTKTWTNHTTLTSNTHYYYQAWSYNETYNTWSSSYAEYDATTNEIIIFYDSFESAVDFSNNWNAGDWLRSTNRATHLSYSAEISGVASNFILELTNSIDLSSITNSYLNFSWFIESALDGGEYLAVELYDGSSWTEIDRLDGTGGTGPEENQWINKNIDLSSYLVSGFKIRFIGSMNHASEYGYVDNVKIVG